MTIKEQIEKLPPDGVMFYGLDSFPIATDDLKALAASHTALLKAGRNWLKECQIEFTPEEMAEDPEMQAMITAIEEAEKL